MAYNDYLKGNFDLAVEGFKMYREQFPASPLADNALYWIGECATARGSSRRPSTRSTSSS